MCEIGDRKTGRMLRTRTITLTRHTMACCTTARAASAPVARAAAAATVRRGVHAHPCNSSAPLLRGREPHPALKSTSHSLHRTAIRTLFIQTQETPNPHAKKFFPGYASCGVHFGAWQDGQASRMQAHRALERRTHSALIFTRSGKRWLRMEGPMSSTRKPTPPCRRWRATCSTLKVLFGTRCVVYDRPLMLPLCGGE